MSSVVQQLLRHLGYTMFNTMFNTTCGESKMLPNIKMSENVMTLIIVSSCKSQFQAFFVDMHLQHDPKRVLKSSKMLNIVYKVKIASDCRLDKISNFLRFFK